MVFLLSHNHGGSAFHVVLLELSCSGTFKITSIRSLEFLGKWKTPTMLSIINWQIIWTFRMIMIIIHDLYSPGAFHTRIGEWVSANFQHCIEL